VNSRAEPSSPDIRTDHTADLDAATLDAARALLFGAFDDFSEHDWEHCLGGMHALAWEDGDLVGHAALVQRRLLHGGRPLRAGFVEGVGVRADRRRRGIGDALMDALERYVRGAHKLGALSATDAGAALYTSRGWQQWKGPLAALTPAGPIATPKDDGSVYVLPVSAPLDLDGELTCDWRDGDVW
jgi:aminoglycoside 2'-N-acetyltransferase I